LNVKLPYVDTYNKERRENARRYSELLVDVDGIITPKRTEGHVFHQYTVRVKDGRREQLQETLSDREVGNKVYYPVPCHQLPVYERYEVRAPEAEQAASEVLSLPMWPQMSTEIQERVSSVIE
jgi:dTDP-4-amino-4,6-dideoxygalactose transaminase